MRWTVVFDIPAFVIEFILLLVFLSYRSFSTKQNKAYGALLVTSCISCVLDVLAAFAGSFWGSKYLILNYIVHVFHLLIVNAIPVIYCYFSYLMVYESGKPDLFRKILIIAPYSVCAFCIIITPFTGLMFTIKEGVYDRGFGQLILYFSAFYYLALACVIVLRHFPVLSKLQSFSVLFYTIANIVCNVIQILFPRYLLQEFCISLSVFFIYLTMQNPLEYMDSHTGTYNRDLFLKVIDNLLNGKTTFSVICIQINGFGYINEKFGMTNGNVLLRQISDFLLSLDKRNKVFHMAGTQFAIVVPDNRDCLPWINRIIDRFDKPFYLNNVEFGFWAYLCCISYPDNISTLNDVIDTIDYSLKEARCNRKSCIMYGSADILAKKRRESFVEQAVRNAVQHKSFDVYYQPIYSVAEHKYTAAEALVRLNDKTLGFISPDEFIPMAEKNGEILSIGEIVLEKVCKYIQENHPEDYGIKKIHVNLSVVQCMQENITQRLFRLIDRYNVPHDLISFEITETTASNSGERLQNVMNSMNERGIRFALDDYGTGYSNTENIMRYPYSIVKLDKSIVWAAENSMKAAILLKYTIAMIKELDMNVLAEGIETLRQAQFLIDLGCEFFQGFFYSRSVKESEFIDVVQNKKILGLK